MLFVAASMTSLPQQTSVQATLTVDYGTYSDDPESVQR